MAFTRQGRGVAPSVASAGCLCPVLVGRWSGLCRVTFLGNQITSQGAYGQCKIEGGLNCEQREHPGLTGSERDEKN